MTDNILKRFSMKGKIVLITGGAHGIGYSLGLAYAQAGAKIVFNARHSAGVGAGLAAYEKKALRHMVMSVMLLMKRQLQG